MDHDQEPFSCPTDEPDSDLTPREDAPPPPEIAELAGLAMDYVRRAIGFELDLTSDTLPVLDHYVGLVRDSLDFRPELVAVVAAAIGAYFGELVRMVLPGFWYLRTPDPAHYYLCMRPVFLALNPLGIAYDVLSRGEDHEGPSPELLLLPAEREAVAQRLRNLPPAGQDEYYLLSTRLEVVQIAAEALRAHYLTGSRGVKDCTLSEYERRLGLDGQIF
jgi:hypothetical protein